MAEVFAEERRGLNEFLRGGVVGVDPGDDLRLHVGSGGEEDEDEFLAGEESLLKVAKGGLNEGTGVIAEHGETPGGDGRAEGLGKLGELDAGVEREGDLPRAAEDLLGCLLFLLAGGPGGRQGP